MAHSLSETLLSQLSDYISDRMGLYFARERWQDLERGLLSAAKELGFAEAEACIPWLLSRSLTRKEVEILASHLTVGETYFFRDKKSFEALEHHILPKLIRSCLNRDRCLRIWSAGCATGEEAYSIAILLTRLIPDIKDWNVSILATDLNPRFLQKAAQGIYTEWSFRETPGWVKDAYFNKGKKRNEFEILSKIREMVRFSYLNLAEDSYPSLVNNTNGMDLILCRNVIMYFSEVIQKKVIRNLHHCLVDEGCLVVSPSEMSHRLFSQYVAVAFPGVSIYKKQTAGNGDQGPDIRDYAAEIRDPRPAIGTEVEASEPETKSPEPRPLSPDPCREARSLYERGSYTEAEEKIWEILSLNQEDTKAMELMSRVKANRGKLAEALDWCEKAITVDKLDAGRHYLRATILQEQDRIEEALISLKRALYLDPDFVLAHFALGNLFRRQGRRKESERHCGHALALLKRYRKDELLAESEGLSAGRLVEIIRSIVPRRGLHERPQ